MSSKGKKTQVKKSLSAKKIKKETKSDSEEYSSEEEIENKKPKLEPEPESEYESDDDETTFNIANESYYDNYIECYEDIDANKLNHIIQNKDKFKKILSKMDAYKNDDFDGVFEKLEAYLFKSRQGKVKVIYRQKNKVGRYIATRGLSMQLLLRPIRQTIAKDYIDIDISNCGPTILKSICEKNKIKCPILNKYCANRDNFLKENGMTKDKGKLLCIEMMNSEKEYKLTDKQKGFKKLDKEFIEIQNEMAKKHDKKYAAFEKKILEEEPEEKNIKGKFLANIIFNEESKILNTIYQFFDKPKSAVLCFDGLMIKPNKKVNYEEKIKECAKYVLEKNDINIKLAIKPFSEKLPDSEFEDMEDYEEMQLKYYSDYKKLINKDFVELEHIQEYTRNVFVMAEYGGNNIFFTKNQETDIKTGRVTIKYTCIRQDELLNNLDRNCNVINPYYNPHFVPDKERGFDIRAKKYLFTNIGKKIGKDNSFLGACIKNMSDENKDKELSTSIISYERVEFYPFLRRKGVPNMHGCFNIWNSFPLENEEITEELDFEQSKFYKHLKIYVCRNNAGELKHLLDTWADKIQRPANARANAHIFYGLPGTGKSIIGEFLTNLVGCDNAVTFINLGKAFDKFNAIGAHKIFKNFEEIGDRGGKFNTQAAENSDFLKGMITALEEMIENKGKDPYKTMHCASYNFFTNHENNLNIENSCRRYTMHHVSPEKARNKKYFAPIWKEIRDTNFLKNAFEYFANREYDEIDIQECYETSYKKEQKIGNLASGIKYLKYLVENDYMTPQPGKSLNGLPKPPVKVELDDGWIDVNVLYQRYIDWIIVNSGQVSANRCSSAGLTTQLKNIGILAGSHRYTLKNGKKSGTIRSYKIDEATILDKIKTYLADFDFEFDKLKHEDDETKVEEKHEDKVEKQHEEEENIKLKEDSDDESKDDPITDIDDEPVKIYDKNSPVRGGAKRIIIYKKSNINNYQDSDSDSDSDADKDN